MPEYDAIGREYLDRSSRARAKQPLNAVQDALTFKHQPHDGALRLNLIRSQYRLGSYPAKRQRATFAEDSQNEALPATEHALRDPAPRVADVFPALKRSL